MLTTRTIYQLNHNGVFALRTNGKKPSPWPPSEAIAEQAADQADDSDKPQFWRCATCQQPITPKDSRMEINGLHEHVCINPHGYVYQIGCFAEAPGCIRVSQPSTDFSWFPGYAWQIAVCGQCQTLTGWAFSSPDSSFWGLILNQLT